MDKMFKCTVLDHSDEIIQLWMTEIETLRIEKYTERISTELFESTNKEFMNVIFSSITDTDAATTLEDFTEKLINFGWPLSYITDGLQAFRRVTIDFILSRTDKIDSDYLSKMLINVNAWVEPIIHQLVNDYSGSWEHVVSLQRMALQELSAPLIPVVDHISVMPLIGTIDTERAKLIMENLLEGIIRHNAKVVLLDITGVPVVDTTVAHHVIQVAEAVRLIGATCILVGIRPEIAQTVVSLGIDLSAFPTQSSLKTGFTTALKITDREIVDLKKEDKTIDNLINSLQKG